MNEFEALCRGALEENGLERFAAPPLLERFSCLAAHLLRENEIMNLTAITDPRGIAVRHIADSLTAAALLPDGASVIDVGCGAGFPALPLAIARPDLTVTALDATAKRVDFVRETAHALGLGNLTAICARAEDAGRGEHREHYGAAVSRAVARLTVLAELCLPLVAPGGLFIAMKGECGEELGEAQRAVALLGGAPSRASELLLYGEGEPQRRTLVSVEKRTATPSGYPRDFSRIKKKPL